MVDSPTEAALIPGSVHDCELTLEEFVEQAKEKLDEMLEDYVEQTGDSGNNTPEYWCEALAAAIHNS